MSAISRAFSEKKSRAEAFVGGIFEKIGVFTAFYGIIKM